MLSQVPNGLFFPYKEKNPAIHGFDGHFAKQNALFRWLQPHTLYGNAVSSIRHGWIFYGNLKTALNKTVYKVVTYVTDLKQSRKIKINISRSLVAKTAVRPKMIVSHPKLLNVIIAKF